jgi:DNA mismatch repair protein MutS
LTSETNIMTQPSSPTPMMVQYFALKQQAQECLLFYRMGDFFELFHEDAKIAASVLDIALTARGEHSGAPIPMCGVPVHAMDAYLARLIKAGHRVAIADQIETPEEAKKRGGSKALVARDIVRVVTAGTLTEDVLLESRSANWLVAICQVHGKLGLCVADISTGRLELNELEAEALESELARLTPKEIIVPEGFAVDLQSAKHTQPSAFQHLFHTRPSRTFDSTACAEWLASLWGSHADEAADDLLAAFSRPELAACAGLLQYLNHVSKGKLPFLLPPIGHKFAAHMLIDAATRDSLELTRTQEGVRKGSLLACIDRCMTGAGARLLAEDIAAPLTDAQAIEARLELVGYYTESQLAREEMRQVLKSLPDIARALGRVVAGRGSPRDLAQLRDGLEQVRHLRERLGSAQHVAVGLGAPAPLPMLLQNLLPLMDGHGALVDILKRALVPAPPLDAKEGGTIALGYDAALDTLRLLASDGRAALAQLEAQYRTQTGIATLKIRHNGVLGYHIEVPAKAADALMLADSGFTHRQSLAGVVRFNAPALHEIALKITQAGAHALAAEAAHLEELTEMVLERKQAIAQSAHALARLDVASALAERAVEGGWCKPQFTQQPVLEVENGRHPVVEAALKQQGARFVGNACALNATKRLWLITGPNMGGKSTYLRQNALIAVLAQMGSYVPASHVRMGLVDRLFSRVGASDNLARGRSTFMVEMVETAAILAQATPRSLVILDEVGRGTSTYDGLAIAWAVVEAVHEVNQCRCLFATHYHELTRLAERLPALANHHVRAREHAGALVLLHEVVAGAADRSYGLAVGKLAGLPPSVLARAKSVLAKLEEGKAKTGGLAAGLQDLPLFASLPEEAPQPDPLHAALAALELDSLSPREALEQLYALKALVKP